jgi:adenylate kinase family enzyme
MKLTPLFILDFPRHKCLINIFRRYIKYRGKVRGDLPEGCREKLDWEFTKWVWDYPKKSRPLILEMPEKYRDCKNVVILKSGNDVENYLYSLLHTL